MTFLANEDIRPIMICVENKQYYVYIMTNRSGTLYVGMTSQLKKRVFEHKQKVVSGFTQKYKISRLVYYEAFSNVYSAIGREKAIKRWRRQKKLDLVNNSNSAWLDLSAEWYE